MVLLCPLQNENDDLSEGKIGIPLSCPLLGWLDDILLELMSRTLNNFGTSGKLFKRAVAHLIPRTIL